MGIPVKAFRVSAEKLFFVCASTAIGMVQMQKSTAIVCSVPDFE